MGWVTVWIEISLLPRHLWWILDSTICDISLLDPLQKLLKRTSSTVLVCRSCTSILPNVTFIPVQHGWGANS